MSRREFSVNDGWERDPSIQSMRRIFAAMETTQREVLRTLGISPLDRRLRVWRQTALYLFEQGWSQAIRKNYRLGERQVADLYCICFAQVIEKAGISILPSALPSDEELIRLAGDILQ